MPDVREKLVELLWEYDQLRMMRMSISECVDHLIENGVTIPLRCKECKHWKHIDHVGCSDLAKVCMLSNYMIGANGYCLYGERKE